MKDTIEGINVSTCILVFSIDLIYTARPNEDCKLTELTLISHSSMNMKGIFFILLVRVTFGPYFCNKIGKSKQNFHFLGKNYRKKKGVNNFSQNKILSGPMNFASEK